MENFEKNLVGTQWYSVLVSQPNRENLGWFVMVWDDLGWSGMIWDNLGWFGMIGGDLGWFGMILDDFGWFGMIWDDLGWFGMILDDLWWFGIIWDDLGWSGMICCDDLGWFGMIRGDLGWSGMISGFTSHFSRRVSASYQFGERHDSSCCIPLPLQFHQLPDKSCYFGNIVRTCKPR